MDCDKNVTNVPVNFVLRIANIFSDPLFGLIQLMAFTAKLVHIDYNSNRNAVTSIPIHQMNCNVVVIFCYC